MRLVSSTKKAQKIDSVPGMEVIGWLLGQWTCLLIGWLVVWLVVSLVGSSIDWFIGWLMRLSMEFLTAWLILVVGFSDGWWNCSAVSSCAIPL